MRKDKLIELVKLNCGGGDVSASVQGKYDPREIELIIDMVYNDLIYALYKQDLAEGKNDLPSLDAFDNSYKCQLEKDDDRNEWFIKLPFQLAVPSNIAIRLVAPFNDQNSAYDIIDNSSLHVFSRLANQLVRPQAICYIEMPYIYFRYLPTKMPENIMVKAISDFDSQDDQADIVVPGGNELLFRKVAELMRTKGIKTLYNLGSDKQV
jgi:hypothetical protein